MVLKRFIALGLMISIIFSCFGTLLVFAGTDKFSLDSLVEVESGTLTDKVLKIEAPYAIGGAYCMITPGAKVLNEESPKTDEMSFVFEIPDLDDYRVFIRAYSSSKNEMFYRWDSGKWQSIAIPEGTDFTWIEFPLERINAGSRKLQLCHGGVNIYCDALYVTADSEFVPETPEGVEPMPVQQESKESFVQYQKDVFVGKEGIIIEAEDLTFNENVSIASSKEASGGKYIYMNGSLWGSANQTMPTEDAEGDIQLSYTTTTEDSYYVWMRCFAPDPDKDSFYLKVDDNIWTSNGSQNGVWYWRCLNAGTPPDLRTLNSDSLYMGEGVAGKKHIFKFTQREKEFMIDQFVIVPKVSYAPQGIVSEIIVEITELIPMSGNPPYNPPAGEHPRLFLRKQDIPELIEKYNHPNNELYKNRLESYAKTPIDAGNTYSQTKVFQIEAKAYYYALFGDEKIGREAVDLALRMGNWKYSGYLQRTAGRNMMAMSIVYDWCYDLMNDEERLKLIESCIGCAQQMEIMWPPNRHGVTTMVGHGAEAQLLRDMMCFAVATYDERPDFWNYIGGRFYNEYADERVWETQTDFHHEGNAYGYYRVWYSVWAHQIVTKMGHPEPYDGAAFARYAYPHQIYARRPDGSRFSSGDMYGNNLMTYGNPYPETLFMAASIAEDPYLRDEFDRTAFSAGASGITADALEETGPALFLALNDPTIEAKSIKNLPLSRYSPEPAGYMFARTGWEEGYESNTACAQFNVGFNWQISGGNHSHFELGNFQIYYKGPLASEAGYYSIWGHDYHRVYYQSTTPHNTILVYDPNEPAVNFYRAANMSNINDGGQMLKTEGTYIAGDHFAKLMNNQDIYKISTVTGHEIDPANPVEPDYTYLSGDLTNAYSDKVKEFKRSFMFLNFKDEEIPAALIVFDKVTSSDSSFKKTWLLHGQSYPEFNSAGTRSVWLSDPLVGASGERYSGKMIVDHMLPVNSTKEVTGGDKESWYIMGGVSMIHPDAVAAEKSAEGETYQLALSESGKATSYFLNCIQVTDEGNKVYLDSELLDTDKFYGVKISDRAVLFSKSGQRINEGFTLTSNGKNFKYTVCDIEKGSYKVTADGEEMLIAVTEDGGVLSFESAAKSISVEPTTENAVETETTEKEIVLGNEDPIYIKVGTNLIGLPVNPKIVNGKLMAPVDVLKGKMEIESKKGFLRDIYYDAKQGITVEVIADSNQLLVNGVPVELENESYYEDGHLMTELRPFAESLNFKVYWDDRLGNVYLYPDKKPLKKPLPAGYEKITYSANDDGEIGNGVAGVIDGDLTSVWSCEGPNRYFTVGFDESTLIENIEIIFNPSGTRSQKFDIQVSNDGENFETVYTGAGTHGCDGETPEVFTFDVNKEVWAKYVRYIGHGSEVNLWNALREVRFKHGKPINAWEDSPSYAEIVRAIDDKDTVDRSIFAQNVCDNNERTYWELNGKGRYFDLELDSVQSINGVCILFASDDNLKYRYEIQVSEDGKDYTTVYKCSDGGGADGITRENVNFEKEVNAKFVRFIGLGNNMNPWNRITEMRVIKAQ